MLNFRARQDFLMDYIYQGYTYQDINEDVFLRTCILKKHFKDVYNIFKNGCLGTDIQYFLDFH